MFGEHKPARSCVEVRFPGLRLCLPSPRLSRLGSLAEPVLPLLSQVAKLPLGVLFEIEGIAQLPK